MTEFEKQLIEQLVKLNKNLSTKDVPTDDHFHSKNFAQYFIELFKNIDKSVTNLNTQTNNLACKVDTLNEILKKKV